jgi:2-dehydropantoate 2-reductase
MTRVIIFGTGAMACLFASRLASMAKVTLLGTWSEAVDSIRRQGIILEDGDTVRKIDVQADYLGSNIEPADLAIVLVKSWQTARIANYLPGCLKPDGKMLSLQNGLGNLEKLGPEAIAGSTTQGATLIGPGHVRACGSGTTLVAGPDWIVGLFEKAGCESRGYPPDKTACLLWGKLAVSCGINALTAILRVHNGELLERPDAADLMVRATSECASVAQACRIDLPYENPEAQVRDAVKRTAMNRSSMLQDILRGAPTECDAINGAVVREGRRLGVMVPVNEVLWKLVRSAELQNRSSDSI